VRARRQHAPAAAAAGRAFRGENLLDVKGLANVAGSKINRELPLAKRYATLIARLEAAGVCSSYAQHGRYAYGFSTENTHYGATRNPHNLGKRRWWILRGSAAPSRRHVPLTLGSDTNGSIRVPASFCGVWGSETHFRAPVRAKASFPSSIRSITPARSPTAWTCSPRLRRHAGRQTRRRLQRSLKGCRLGARSDTSKTTPSPRS